MPTALETLVKILKLERQQGCKNTAVIGGLGAYSSNWKRDATAQARRAEQRVLVDELTQIMTEYDQIESQSERLSRLGYMMDRITGRAPIPERYQPALERYQQEYAQKAATQATDQPAEREARPLRHERQKPEQGADQTGQATAEADSSADERQSRRSKRARKRKGNPDTGDAPAAQAQAANQGSTSKKKRQENKPRQKPQGQQQGGGQPGVNGGNEPVYDTDEGFEATYTGQMDIPAEPRLARPPRQPRPALEPEEALDILRGLNAPVTTVKGVGPQMAKSLEKLGIHTINDLLFNLPRRYDDYTRLLTINKLQPEAVVTVIGTVRRTEVLIGRNSRKDFYMELDDGTGTLPIRFFGQHFLIRQVRAGQQLVVSGKTTLFQGRVQMTNPEWEQLDTDNLHTVGIVPVYPLTEGLSGRSLRRLMKTTVDYWADRLMDYMPEAVLERCELGDLGWTLKNLHFPEGQDHLQHARRRYAFDQLLLLQMAVLANRRAWQSTPAHGLTVSDEFLEDFISRAFPYPLTGAQRRAIEDIRQDISQPVPMNRLLQGDVGSGKTAVATVALAMAFANGRQGAIMAPTSILAEQHYRGISRTFEAVYTPALPATEPSEFDETVEMPTEPVRRPVIALLTGALSSGEREATYRGIADGSIDIVIGTHALIQEGVEFHDLSLAIIDEQHRFGVEQRGTLRGKGTNPHLLVMTATPIPRTLALTLHADLDLSIMDEMPPGRIPIHTRIVYPSERRRVYTFIEAQLEKGRQAFVVYPLVEASASEALSDVKAATDAYDELKRIFYRHRVGLLHGRLRPAEKDQVMEAFARHEFDILVTTSVAEVGVDVPNASVMVIEGANRFGLAQLHQFRGRVGRGAHESYCLLIPDNATPEALERLEALESTTDGFKLAEIDWRLRGPGDLVGTQQSGRGGLQLTELMLPELVELAQREARTIYAEDPDLIKPEHRLLARRVAMLYNPGSDVS